nr:PREDICTED: uncharacterized protein LOC106705633 [Latimeria chalumnae]|eukprot:XP_014350909.1 PREDICTED: uncharacterized protein LOC106705633 [Latimeria chalumnae]
MGGKESVDTKLDEQDQLKKAARTMCVNVLQENSQFYTKGLMLSNKNEVVIDQVKHELPKPELDAVCSSVIADSGQCIGEIQGSCMKLSIKNEQSPDYKTSCTKSLKNNSSLYETYEREPGNIPFASLQNNLDSLEQKYSTKESSGGLLQKNYSSDLVLENFSQTAKDDHMSSEVVNAKISSITHATDGIIPVLEKFETAVKYIGESSENLSNLKPQTVLHNENIEHEFKKQNLDGCCSSQRLDRVNQEKLHQKNLLISSSINDCIPKEAINGVGKPQKKRVASGEANAKSKSLKVSDEKNDRCWLVLKKQHNKMSLDQWKQTFSELN